MKKEFIPYTQALALKELGFDEPCLAIYEHKSKKLLPRSGLIPDWFNKTDDNKGFEWKMSAPLYQQAFRWFREKYGLYHEIKMFGDWDKPQYSYIVSGRTMTNPAHMWHYEYKDSHEEAELACLKKLIEIVKNK
jgi:hypothetical protein